MVNTKATLDPIRPTVVKRRPRPLRINFGAANPRQVNHGNGLQGIGRGEENVVAVTAPTDGNHRHSVQDMLESQFFLKFSHERIP